MDWHRSKLLFSLGLKPAQVQLSGFIDTYLQLSAEIICQALDCHPCFIETSKPNIAAKEAVNSGCVVVERDDGGAMVLN